MSIFGTRIIQANYLIDQEFGDIFLYKPMKEVVNGPPELDDSRPGGNVRVIILQPGMILGRQLGLNSMHQRSSSSPTLFYMARGLLTQVQKFDRFFLPIGRTNPDVEREYEVADGPRPIGFGRHKADVIELGLSTEASQANILDMSDEVPF